MQANRSYLENQLKNNLYSPPALFLRESYREAARVRKRTLANLSKWPSELVESLRALLQGGHVVSDLSQAFELQRSRPHGHVASVLGTLRRLGLERLLASRNSLRRRFGVALIVARILKPRSKPATARGWGPQTLSSSLSELLQVESATADDLYGALSWLLARQEKIENGLASQRCSRGCGALRRNIGRAAAPLPEPLNQIRVSLRVQCAETPRRCSLG